MVDGMASTVVKVPRITISYCTQCRWMLRAAYFAQELLTTFGTAIGEIALQPATGGLFQVHLTHVRPGTADESSNGPETVLIWDRKSEGGFPETKVLKQKIRDHIEPEKDLGHSDKPGKASATKPEPAEEAFKKPLEGKCEDCPL